MSAVGVTVCLLLVTMAMKMLCLVGGLNTHLHNYDKKQGKFFKFTYLGNGAEKNKQIKAEMKERKNTTPHLLFFSCRCCVIYLHFFLFALFLYFVRPITKRMKFSMNFFANFKCVYKRYYASLSSHSFFFSSFSSFYKTAHYY